MNNRFVSAKAAFLTFALAPLLFTSCEKSAQEVAPGHEDVATSGLRVGNTGPGEQFMPNQILIKFRKGVSAEARTSMLKMIGGKVSEKVLTRTMERYGDSEGLLVINTPMAALEAISKAKGFEGIEFAEPNYIYQHQAATTDNYYTDGSLWGMYGDATIPSNQFGCQAGEAWAAGNTGSKSVVVGIIDEGVQVTHPDLAVNMWVNPGEIADNLIDDDANGYIDDINGWDFVNNDNSVYDGGTSGNVDDHGTHVAGTIGAANNGRGVVGVNWDVTMISCKFLGQNGGTTATAIKALDYLTDLKAKHGVNIKAINNSWGGGGYSQLLEAAIKRAGDNNILFIAAAGNNGANNDAKISPNYPSNYNSNNVIAVASITSTGALSSFSNYGATTVDIGAPGSAIWSTTAFNLLSNFNGTSMATPHVTGAAALYAASHPGATAAEIKAAILNSAVPTKSLSRKCVTGGRLNVSNL